MNINLPPGACKTVPKKAWIIISIGITILLIFVGMTLYKYGSISVKLEKEANSKMDKIVEEVNKLP